MKKVEDDDMRRSYKRSDFATLERGKFYKEVAKGTSVVLLGEPAAAAAPADARPEVATQRDADGSGLCGRRLELDSRGLQARGLRDDGARPVPLEAVRYSLPVNETSERSDRALPISERIQLVEDIRDSIADETAGGLPLSAEQRAELHRRRAEHEADPSSAAPWEQLRAELPDSQRCSAG